MARLQVWDHLQMTVKLAKQLKDWNVQSFAFQGEHTACSNHFKLVWYHKGIEPQAQSPATAVASNQVWPHAAAASRV